MSFFDGSFLGLNKGKPKANKGKTKASHRQTKDKPAIVYCFSPPSLLYIYMICIYIYILGIHCGVTAPVSAGRGRAAGGRHCGRPRLGAGLALQGLPCELFVGDCFLFLLFVFLGLVTEGRVNAPLHIGLVIEGRVKAPLEAWVTLK